MKHRARICTNFKYIKRLKKGSDFDFTSRPFFVYKIFILRWIEIVIITKKICLMYFKIQHKKSKDYILKIINQRN